MKDDTKINAIAIGIVVLIILFVVMLFSSGSDSSNKSSRPTPSSSMKSTYEKTLQKVQDGVPLTDTEKKFLDSYVKAGY